MATTYYVATTGSNSNPGTLAQPFLTIAKGLSVMVAGDILYIRTGTYAEDMRDTIPSGSSWSTATTVSAYNSEVVTLRPTHSGDWQIVDINSANYIVLDGLIFDGINITGGTFSTGVRIQNTAGHVRIIRCEIKNIRGVGIGLFSPTAPGFNEVQYTSSHDNGISDLHHGIYIQSSDNLVEHCNIYNNYEYGIHVYTSTGTTNRNTIRANLSHNNATNPAASFGSGVLLSSGSNNAAYNNICYGNAFGVRVAYSGTGNLVYNNTLVDNTELGGNIGIWLAAGPTGTIVKNNIIRGSATAIQNDQTGAIISNNLTADPLFVDGTGPAYDFHLTAASPARNTGTTIAAVINDFDGVSRPQSIAYDIGAYEFVGGANWYVDNSLPNGNGSSSSPFNSIQNAFNNSALQAGDHIKIRTGTGTYDQNAILTKSGISGNPITIQPDTGASFIVRFTTASSNLQTGAIVLQDCSYVTVSGLNFNGAGINTPNYALEFLASSTDPTNLICTGCTFQNWGGSQAFVNTNATRAAMFSRNASTSTHFVSQSTITNCTFTNNRQRNISILGGTTHTISNNTITGTLGGRNGDGSVEAGGIKFDGDSSVTGPNSNPTGHIVSNNSIHDFAAYTTWTLSPMGDSNWFGVYGDVNIDNVDVRNNTIYNIGTISTSTSVGVLNPGVTGNSLQTFGINPESRCDSWLIHENVLYRLGTRGILLGSFSRHGINHSVYNNTIYKMGAIGIMINTTDTVSTLNSNIVLDAGTSQIDWEPPVSAQGFVDYNCYFSTTNVNAIGRYDTGSVTNFTNYKAQSGFDSHSISVNPLFVSLTVGSEDFHLQSSSPCIATGFNNVTMGALPFIGVANVATNSVGDTTFNDTWITAAAADTQTAFGTTTSYNGLTAKNISSVTSHADSVFNLTPNTLYHFRALSSGSSSPDQVIITNLPPATSLSMS